MRFIPTTILSLAVALAFPVGSVGAPPDASKQGDTRDARRERAIQLFRASEGLYREGRFEEAAELTYPRYVQQMGRIGRERGWGPVGRPRSDLEVAPQGAMVLGDPETVARKIIREHGLFGFTRFSLQFSVGSVPHDRMLRCIELYATEVVPRVRAAVGA